MNLQKCHRLGCTNNNQPLRGVRDRSGEVLVFCLPCFRELVRSQVIDMNTGETMTPNS
jgi:hypothetical protein